jgi:hypothetical protein
MRQAIAQSPRSGCDRTTVLDSKTAAILLLNKRNFSLYDFGVRRVAALALLTVWLSEMY